MLDRLALIEYYLFQVPLPSHLEADGESIIPLPPINWMDDDAEDEVKTRIKAFTTFKTLITACEIARIEVKLIERAKTLSEECGTTKELSSLVSAVKVLYTHLDKLSNLSDETGLPTVIIRDLSGTNGQDSNQD